MDSIRPRVPRPIRRMGTEVIDPRPSRQRTRGQADARAIQDEIDELRDTLDEEMEDAE